MQQPKDLLFLILLKAGETILSFFFFHLRAYNDLIPGALWVTLQLSCFQAPFQSGSGGVRVTMYFYIVVKTNNNMIFTIN